MADGMVSYDDLDLTSYRVGRDEVSWELIAMYPHADQIEAFAYVHEINLQGGEAEISSAVDWLIRHNAPTHQLGER